MNVFTAIQEFTQQRSMRKQLLGAIDRGDATECGKLLAAGAKPNNAPKTEREFAPPPRKQSPMSRAIVRRQPELVKLLFDHGAVIGGHEVHCASSMIQKCRQNPDHARAGWQVLLAMRHAGCEFDSMVGADVRTSFLPPPVTYRRQIDEHLSAISPDPAFSLKRIDEIHEAMLQSEKLHSATTVSATSIKARPSRL